MKLQNSNKKRKQTATNYTDNKYSLSCSVQADQKQRTQSTDGTIKETKRFDGTNDHDKFSSNSPFPSHSWDDDNVTSCWYRGAGWGGSASERFSAGVMNVEDVRPQPPRNPAPEHRVSHDTHTYTFSVGFWHLRSWTAPTSSSPRGTPSCNLWRPARTTRLY